MRNYRFFINLISLRYTFDGDHTKLIYRTHLWIVETIIELLSTKLKKRCGSNKNNLLFQQTGCDIHTGTFNIGSNGQTGGQKNCFKKV